uniref:CSON011015 protein n=1 Tax=Culicoides sonorensis TaxID=179676 RepID=A0A336M3S4_CULSO
MIKQICILLSIVSIILIADANELDKTATIVSYENIIEPDGKYKFGYETSNGIVANEEGEGGVSAIGYYKYVDADGETVQVNYIADENGFQPDNLPEVPEIPPLIARALEYLRDNAPAQK